MSIERDLISTVCDGADAEFEEEVDVSTEFQLLHIDLVTDQAGPIICPSGAAEVPRWRNDVFDFAGLTRHRRHCKI